MAGTIRITPEELREAATYLGQRQEALVNEANSIKAKLEEISNNWEGAAQSAFMEGFNGDMWPILHDKLPELLQGIQEQLKGAAANLEDTDQKIASDLRGK